MSAGDPRQGFMCPASPVGQCDGVGGERAGGHDRRATDGDALLVESRVRNAQGEDLPIQRGVVFPFRRRRMTEMTPAQIDAFLANARIGRVCMATPDGEPYVIPLPFCWH